MKRRTLLCWTGAIGSLTVAGCVTSNNRNSTNENGDGTETTQKQTSTDEQSGEQSDVPTEDLIRVVKTYYTALESGNVTRANAVLHKDGDFGTLSKDDMNPDKSYTIVESKFTTKESDKVTVEILLSYSGASRTQQVDNSATPMRVQLRTEDGEWKIWTIDAQVQEIIPYTRFESTRQNGTLKITHNGGDSIPANQLYLYGEGIESTGSWAELGGETDDNGNVVSGNTLTISAESLYQYGLYWDSGQTKVLISFHDSLPGE